MADQNKNRLIPYLCAKNAAAAIDFYQQAFGAKVGWRMDGPDGKVMHADLRIGDVEFMISDEFPDFGALSPETIGGAPMSLYLLVENVDAVFERALAAGAKATRPIENKFYGHRTGSLTDPYGFRWSIGTVIEELTPEQLDERAGIKREVNA